MQTAYLHYRSSRIHYAYGGSGAIPCICFHGYGESLTSFNFLEQSLPAGYRLIALDMPFHGRTDWKEKAPLTKDDLGAILKQLSVTLQLAPPFTLLGFSMGGRICLNLLQQMPEQIGRVVLVAPDGLVMNRWHYFATQTAMGNRVFSFTMQHPGWFRALLGIARTLGVVNKSIYKFTRYYIQDRESCRQLYERWTCLSELIPGMEQIISHIKQRNIPVHILYGEHDRIAKREHAGAMEQAAQAQCKVHILPGGHQLLQEKNAPMIVQCIVS